MVVPWLLSTIPVLLVLASVVNAEVKLYINTTTDIPTECKTCPRSLCPNKVAYNWEENFNVTCWTRGTKIVDDRLWLKSGDGCYVTQWDLIEYAGDYTQDLEYCGVESEEQHLTIEDATLKYKTECKICPTLSCGVVAYLPEKTDLELTCWTPEGQTIIDDPYWLKTTNNCYVAQKNLYSKPDITYLDNCGPIPYILEIADHNNQNGTTDVNKRHLAPEPLPKPAEMGAKYLINVTIGEEYAYCYSCTNDACEVEQTYSFNQEVYLQCIVNANETFWSMTTDFCYVKDSDIWEAPDGDYIYFPYCSLFDGNGRGTGDESAGQKHKQPSRVGP